MHLYYFGTVITNLIFNTNKSEKQGLQSSHQSVQEEIENTIIIDEFNTPVSAKDK